MLLYHGSLVIIKEPDLSFSKGRRDFGKGFYLTSSLEQAVKWAKRNMRINNLDKGYVSIYEFDEKALIKTKVFSNANRDWLQFVVDNRLQKKLNNEFDLIVGPVADDQAYNTIILYEDGIIDEDYAIRKLMSEKLHDQYLFRTQKALSYLKYTIYMEVSND